MRFVVRDLVALTAEVSVAKSMGARSDSTLQRNYAADADAARTEGDLQIAKRYSEIVERYEQLIQQTRAFAENQA